MEANSQSCDEVLETALEDGVVMVVAVKMAEEHSRPVVSTRQEAPWRKRHTEVIGVQPCLTYPKSLPNAPGKDDRSFLLH